MVGVGVDALFKNTKGTNNTAIGYQADVNIDDLDNATAIGAGATVNAKIATALTKITFLNISHPP